MDKKLFVVAAAVLGALAVFYTFVLSGGDNGDTVTEAPAAEVATPSE